jgi:plasmid maintenance system antidote protein VapI
VENEEIPYSEIVRVNTRFLAEQAGGIAKFAEKMKMSDPQASQIIGKTPSRNIGHRLARRIETVFDKPVGWIDQVHSESGLAMLEPQIMLEQTANELSVLKEQVRRAAACLRAYGTAESADRETLVGLALSLLEEEA